MPVASSNGVEGEEEADSTPPESSEPPTETAVEAVPSKGDTCRWLVVWGVELIAVAWTLRSDIKAS